MAEQVKTTEFYSFPLSWENYPTDRLLIEEAFERIDSAINDLSGDSANDAANVGYSDPDGTTISVQTALDTVYARTNTFEIAAMATGGCDSGEALWTYTSARGFALPANLDGSQATVKRLNAPVDLTINILFNGTSVGTIVITEDIASFDVPIDVVFTAGSTLELVATSAVTFKTITLTLLANRLG